MELIPIHFRLSAFIENICSTSKFAAQAKNLSFESEIEEGLPEFLYCDEVRTRQVITNIISNAVKYTRRGSIKLEVSAVTAENEEKMLLFTVTDTGIGMKRENIPRMFDAFVNPESGKSRGLKGSGLGLAICKSIMEMVNGKIEFDSEEGKGSEFRLYFPLVVGDGNAIEEIKTGEKIYAKNAKVLIVDDNSINVTVALGIFAAHDIRPDVAKDGYKAIAMVKQKDYDMIFMDQFMPGIDGIETTQRIREMGGKHLSVPIIAMTANIVQGVRDMLIFNGMNDYISKPVDHNALNNILIRWLPHDKTCSSLGRFGQEEESEPLIGLPIELMAITEINCNAALKNTDGSVEIFMGLLRRFTSEVYDYVDSLNEYLRESDFREYLIVINGIKNLLFNIGAKAGGDMAARLEKAAIEEDEKYCLDKNEQFCESLRWLAQRILLALPYQHGSEKENNGGTPSELVKLAGIMQDLSFDFSIGDCDSIDKYTAILKSTSFGEEYEELITGIISEAEVMEYEKAAEVCKKMLKLLLDE
jgi:CheY-like chemotaxis protein/anti-sigma regulatory factor (Ser/Thr protein kinase)